MYKLIIEDDEGKTTVVPLIRDEISIGRKEGNTIRLTERNVSRRHARLMRQNGTVYIEDLQSHNGIKVNGDRINGKVVVGEGDRIQIGDYQLSLKLDRTEQRPPRSQQDDPPTTPFVKSQEPTAQVPVPSTAATAQMMAPPPSPPAQPPLPPAVPTVPIAAVTMPVPQGAQGKDKPARLVVVSKNFFRQEFPLDKAAVVIGRTDENDVVVNHRSISRHHAKIVREGGHYHIIDLQSANGVRVNGEEYGKVELRKGDQIDLGHVRMVFVPPGAEVDITKPVNTEDDDKKPVLALVIVVLLIVGGAVAAVRYSDRIFGGGSKATDTEAEAGKILLDVDTDLRERRWDEALTRIDRLMNLAGITDKVKSVAVERRGRAESEKKAKVNFDEFASAVGKKDYDGALRLYKAIPVGSGYLPEAKEAVDKIFPIFAEQHLGKAEQERLAGNCGNFEAEVNMVLAVEPTHFKAQNTKALQCPVEASPQPPGPGRRPGKPPRGERPAGPGTAETPAKPTPDEGPEPADVETALRDAQNAYVNGDYGRAIALAKPVKGSSTVVSRAWRIVGAAACNLKDTKLAGDAYRKLDATGRQFLTYVCARAGMPYDKEKNQFSPAE